MVKEVKFLVYFNKENSNLVLFSYWPYYYCFTEERCDESYNYFHGPKIVKKEDLGEIVDLVVEDWMLYELGKNKDYILGLTNCVSVPAIFPTNDAKESFKNCIAAELSRMFNDDFIESSVQDIKNYLFDVLIDIEERECEVIASKIEEYEPIDKANQVRSFEKGAFVSEETRKTKESNIKFIIKTVPSLKATKGDFCSDLFYFTYNLYCNALYKNEVHDGNSMFSMFQEHNEFACCGWAVEDWFQLQLMKSKNYILGFGLDDALEKIVPKYGVLLDIEDAIQDVVCKKFSRNFIEKYDNKPHAFLFDIIFEYCMDKCKVISSNVKDILNEEDPSFVGLSVLRRELLNVDIKDFC